MYAGDFGCKDGTVLPVRLWLPLAVFGILLAPAKLVYLPLAALFLLIPNSRFGQSAATKKPLIWPDACCWHSASTALCWSPRWPVLPGLKSDYSDGNHLRTGFYPGCRGFLYSNRGS